MSLAKGLSNTLPSMRVSTKWKLPLRLFIKITFLITVSITLWSLYSIANSHLQLDDYPLVKNFASSPKSRIANYLPSKLSLQDFTNQKADTHDKSTNSRYESNDVWRSKASLEPAWVPSKLRPKMPPLEDFKSIGEYLKQPIVADYAQNSEKMFMMVKTGGSELWSKLPVQLYTTLTRLPYFAIYSDAPGSIAGYEVIDVLENSTESALKSDAFKMYRAQKHLHDTRGMADYSEVTINQGWDLDKFKNIPMLAHAYRVAPPTVEWFMFIDADTYVMMDNIMEWLKQYNPNKPYYFGSKAYLGDIPFAHGGTGVVISREALKRTVGEKPQEIIEKYEKKAFSSCCGDALVGEMLLEYLNITVQTGFDNQYYSVFQGNPVWDLEFSKLKWCHPVLSFHHVSPHDIELLYEYERLKGPKNRAKIKYSDLYLDFVAPYIDTVVPNWDSLANEKRYSNKEDSEHKWKPSSEGGAVVRPYESAEQCLLACKESKDCTSYRYLPEQQFCGLGFGHIKLGRPVYPWLKPSDPKINVANATSGWLVDRIRALRKQQKCDPLHKDPKSEGMESNGDENDYIEGWARRRAKDVPNSV